MYCAGGIAEAECQYLASFSVRPSWQGKRFLLALSLPCRLGGPEESQVPNCTASFVATLPVHIVFGHTARSFPCGTA